MKTLDKSDKRYTIDTIRDEARQLVEKGCVSRDEIADLLAHESWESD